MVFKIISYIAIFLLGVLIEATDYQALVKDVSWTDIIAAISTFATALIVYKTYSMWLESRKREDSYQTSKDYISALVAIGDHVVELMYPFNLSVPQAGGIPIDSEQCQKLLTMSNLALHKLVTERRKLFLVHAELAFWGVSLTSISEKTHQKILQELQSIIVITGSLQSQINYYYTMDTKDMSGMLSEFALFNEKVGNLTEHLNSRYNNKYSDFFVYKK
ncbi:hypothetical protein [Aliivibrio fischeri]|uniref:hypothetical protein n=1 Tax=Aliivibrio fischeri TaxID=668 RepID=UPI00166D21F0|nr:hypothetical protein [Aliivibrio fischeri]USR97112.1 hypothetical protein AVFI_18175 [Aliivibrio fischeri ATCC 7744 = JCM 18803 = DSM 507]GGK49952.1 hypothetical protein GCM10007987_36260 [Aliivibrio fischeri]